MSSIKKWFTGSQGKLVDQEKATEADPLQVEPQEPDQLLPSLSEDELEKLKHEKAKRLRRDQLDVIYSSEALLRTTVAALQKSLVHYESQRVEIYGKRQKYRIIIAKYNGPDDEKKLEAIKEILHRDLPALLEELNERIEAGKDQLEQLQNQLRSLAHHRRKANRAYERMFEGSGNPDLEAGEVEEESSDDDERGKNVPIEEILHRYDPINFPAPSRPPPSSNLYDTSSSDEEVDHDVELEDSETAKMRHEQNLPNDRIENPFGPSNNSTKQGYNGLMKKKKKEEIGEELIGLELQPTSSSTSLTNPTQQQQ